MKPIENIYSYKILKNFLGASFGHRNLEKGLFRQIYYAFITLTLGLFSTYLNNEDNIYGRSTLEKMMRTI